MEYYPAMKMIEILPSAITWMDLEGIMLSEISQNGQTPYDVTYMWNRKHNKPVNKTKEKQTWREQSSSYLWGEESGKG